MLYQQVWIRAGERLLFLRKILLDKYPVGVYKVRKETKRQRSWHLVSPERITKKSKAAR